MPSDDELRARCEELLRMYPREEMRDSLEAPFRVVDVMGLLDRLRNTQAELRQRNKDLETEGAARQQVISDFRRFQEKARRDAMAVEERLKLIQDWLDDPLRCTFADACPVGVIVGPYSTLTMGDLRGLVEAAERPAIEGT